MTDLGVASTTPTAPGGALLGGTASDALPAVSTGGPAGSGPVLASGGRKQEDDGTDTDAEGQAHKTSKPPAKAAATAAAAAVKRPPPKRPAGAITLSTLLDEGLLRAGPEALSMEYKGTLTFAALTEDGRILWEGMSFDSPSAFTIYIKRQTNPKRKADDGWKTLKYGGKFLEAYKVELMMRRYAEDGGGEAEGSYAAPVKRPRTEHGPILKQLAPRVKPSARAAAGGSAAAGAAAPSASTAEGGSRPAAAAAGGGGAASSSSRALQDSTPRPDALASQPVAEHDFAPGEGAVLPEAHDPERLLQQQAAATTGRYFVTGAELDSGAAAQQPEGGAEAVNASGRPRRTVKAPERLIDTLKERGPYDMVRCGTYSGRSGSGAGGSQPFQVLVSPCCEVIMDFHAHLDTHEVIGLLAGTWHPEQRLLLVQRAFPVREALPSAPGHSSSSRGGDEDHTTAGTDHINVEMDSEDQFKVTEVIQELYGLQVVGWYHSHPTFCPMPSSIDICNQLMMQRNAAAGGGSDSGSGAGGAQGGTEPYIGAILSPYEPRLPEPQSAVTWFHVRHDASKQVSQDRDLAEQGVAPMELQVERLIAQDTPQQLQSLAPQLAVTAARYAVKRSAVNLAAPWRGGPISKVQKLLRSTTSWLPTSSFTPEAREQYGQQVLQAIQGARQQARLAPLPAPGSSGTAAAAAVDRPQPQPQAQEQQQQQQGGLVLSPALGAAEAPSEPLPGLELPGPQTLVPLPPESWPGTSNGTLGLFHG